MSTDLVPADDLLRDPLADLPWSPRPDVATVVHVPSLLHPRERTITRIDRRQRLGRWLWRQGHDLVECRTICAINGQWMPRSQWTVYRPRKGDLILLIDHPYAGGDGGSNPLAAILMIAAIIFMPYALPALTGLGLSTGMAQAVYMLGVNLLVSALTQPAKPPAAHAQAEMAAPSPTYTLGAQGNANRLGSPRPRHYGRFRFTPAYCAQAYGEFADNEHMLYEIFDVGLGEYQIDKVSIEDTDVSAFADIQYEIVPPGGAITLVPGRVQNSGEVAGQELLQGTWVGGTIGFVAVSAGSVATGIGVDYVCPQGLFSVNDDGSFAALSIQIRFEAVSVDNNGNHTGSWFPLGDETFSAATNTPQRRTRNYTVSAGRYAVRGTRIDVKSTSTRAGHEVTWASLRAYLPGDLVYPDNTVIVMKAKASGQLTQASARKVFVQGIGKVKTWSPSGWTAPVASRSIAWAAADILMAKYGHNAEAALIDLDKLYQLEQTWIARGDTLDATFDTRSTVSEALTGCLKAGRAQWFRIAGLFSFARDEAVMVPSATFTPQNIVRGSVEVEYVMPGDRTSDYVIGKYFDTQVFNWREVECKLTGSTATKPARVTYFGVGDHDQAWREGITDAAENLYRRRIVKFSTEMEGRLLLPLDTIALSHTLVNRSQTGEVVAFSGDDGDGGLAVGAELVLTGEVEFTAGQTHYLIMSTLTGGRSGPWRVTEGATPDRVLLAEAVADFQPYVGGGKQRSRFAFGIGSEVYVLGKVVPPLKPKGRQVEIQMVVDDPRVHNADQTHILPPPAVGWGLPKTPERPVLASLLVSQSGDPASPVITASWLNVAGAVFYVVEWSSDALDWRRAGGDTSGNNQSFSVPPGALHVRACAVGKMAGPWAVWSGVAGEVPPPGRPQGLVLVETWLSTRARWKWGAAARASSYEVEIHAGGALRRSFETTGLTYDYDADQVRADGGPWRSIEIKVRAKGPTGESDWVSLISVNPQVGLLSGVTFVPGYLQVIGTYNLPADTDFSGARVAMSLTTGFDQTAPENLAYDGYDQVFVLTQGPGGVAFAADQVWYVRIAGYDKFGTDELLWSAEHQVTIAGVDASMTPEQILAALNSSFVQGNVVLAGSGAITVYNGAPSVPNRDFALLSAGTLSFQRYRGGQYREYKSVKRVENGVAPSGQTVTLQGYWDGQPKVTVSPQSLMSFKTSAKDQDQTWACRADNLREDPAASGIWKFDAKAELQLSSASDSTSINQNTGDTASNAWDSSTYMLTSASTHDMTVNVQVKSKRGTGAHTAEWAYRAVLVQVYAYSASAGWYVAGSTTVSVGAALDTTLGAAVSCPNLQPGTDRFFVRYTASDVGGVFSTGVDVYETGEDIVTGSNGTTGYAWAGYNQGWDQNGNATPLIGGLRSALYTMPSSTPPSGWEVTGTSYSYSISAVVANAAHYFVAPDRNTYYPYGTTTWGSRTLVESVWVYNYVSKTAFIPGAYDANGLHAEIYTPSMNGQVRLKNVVATISRRRLTTNGATPVNAFILGGYDWQVVGSTALSTGSINYMAVGD